jgi:hypothetical protein
MIRNALTALAASIATLSVFVSTMAALAGGPGMIA